jgi:RNA polymerase sigma-70 factor (ECF subfamily)
VDKNDPDLALVASVLAGEKDKFKFLVREHQKAVYAMGMGFFRNEDDAADFSQDVFVKAFRSLRHFEGRSRFSTWLYKIAYNTALNGVQRRKEYLSLSEETEVSGAGPGPGSVGNPEEQTLKEAGRQAVHKAVSELPEKYRLCVDLYFFYGRSYQEIETITGTPVNTIKSHVFRAKKLLREALADFV